MMVRFRFVKKNNGQARMLDLPVESLIVEHPGKTSFQLVKGTMVSFQFVKEMMVKQGCLTSQCQDEYRMILNSYEVEYDENYVWD